MGTVQEGPTILNYTSSEVCCLPYALDDSRFLVSNVNKRTALYMVHNP